MSLYFIRHGESDANANKYFAGQSDIPLTERGHRQARQEAERLRNLGESFDVILSSELRRAYETAVPIAKAIRYPVESIIVTPLLNERGGGSYEGRALQEFFSLSEAEQIAGGAESFKQLGERAVELLDLINKEYHGRKVLLVSHATLGEMLQAILTYGDYTRVLDGEKIPNTTTIQLR